MRIVIDMQGAQTASRVRGIGRYSVSFVRALIRNGHKHEVLLALNGLFPETIASLRETFRDLLPPENIRVWYAPTPGSACQASNGVHRKRAQYIYGAFLQSLEPDIVHITSLFEGFADNAVSSIGSLPPRLPTTVTFYDLIPLHHAERFLHPNPAYEKWYHEQLDLLKKADILFAISEASASDARETLKINPSRILNVSTSRQDIFRPIEVSEKAASETVLKFGIKKPFVLISGTLDPHKNLDRLFRSFSLLPKALRDQYCVVLIGNALGPQQALLKKMAREAGMEETSLVLTGHISDQDLVALYNLCTLMVLPSYHEGFGLPLLEAMACGAAVIGANATSVPEVIGREDALFDPFDEHSIAAKLEQALTNSALHASLKEHGPRRAALFSWDETATRALRSMEKLVAERRAENAYGEFSQSDPLDQCIEALAKSNPPPTKPECVAISACLARSIVSKDRTPQVLVDVSELSQRDARTGCQRVTRSVVLELLKTPPAGFRIEPVFATADRPGYRYARTFTARLMGEAARGDDLPIDYAPGDVFFGLDYQAHIVTRQRKFLQQMNRDGVQIHFLVYDILSVLKPHFFMPGNEPVFRSWLETIGLFDGVIGISKATADALDAWYKEQSFQVTPHFRFAWAHLGADIENSAPTFGLPADASEVLKRLRQRPTFLMVSTIEPRKGYAQALAAAEELWKEGLDINLAIVGRQGWNTEDLVKKLRAHPERGSRLFWLEGISDEYLEKVYAASTCLIAASEGEGFGLPLIEAARHKLPILARDIAVFREVAGEHAAYFSGLQPDDLAGAIRDWLSLYREGAHPKSDAMPWITWKESAERMIAALLDPDRVTPDTKRAFKDLAVNA
jgi:glycosyltransferase involved in cell wall biosynthesis